MRRKIRWFVTAASLVGLAAAGLPAGPAAATHNTDEHSANMTRLFNSPGPTGVTNSDLAFWGDRAYVANYAGFRIFNISNPAAPTLVTSASCISTPAGQHDISVWNNDADAAADLLFLSVDGARVGASGTPPAFDAAVDPTGCSNTVAASATSTAQMEQAWEGVRIFDINSEASPVQVAAVPTDCGSHTHTLVPTDDGVGAPAAGTSLYVYVSSYPTNFWTNDTDYADSAGETAQGADFGAADRVAGQRSNGTDCLEPEARPDEATGDWTANKGHNKISIIKVDLTSMATVAAADDPTLRVENLAATPAVSCDGPTVAMPLAGSPGAADNCIVYPQIAEWTLPSGTRMTHLASPTRTNSFISCHDIAVFIDLDLAAGACWDEGQLWDISDPFLPDFLRRFRNNEVDLLVHSATFTWDGKYVAFEDEAGGGADDRCRDVNDLQGRMWFYNTSLNLQSSFKIPRPQAKNENCTAHNYNFIPQTNGNDIMTSAWYTGGTSMIDFTNPTAPKEIGFYDANSPVTGGTTNVGSDVWSSYWYNGYVYVNDILRGFEVLDFNDSRANAAVTLPFLNPQTQMSPIPQVVPSCRGQAATIVGTSGADTLTGTVGPDVIVGLGGKDTIRGLGGQDRICGGAGADKIVGGGGPDRLSGNRGADRISGGPGGDNLNGGPGRDRCNGGPGADRLRACEVVVG
jgi:hypothetical protein